LNLEKNKEKNKRKNKKGYCTDLKTFLKYIEVDTFFRIIFIYTIEKKQQEHLCIQDDPVNFDGVAKFVVFVENLRYLLFW